MNKKNILMPIAALLVSILALAYAWFNPGRETVVERLGGASTFDEIVTGGDGGIAERWVRLGQLGGLNASGTAQISFRNVTGARFWVDRIAIFQVGSSSATFVIDMGTTTQRADKTGSAVSDLINFAVDYARPTTTPLWMVNSYRYATNTTDTFVLTNITEASTTRATMANSGTRFTPIYDTINPGDKATHLGTAVQPLEYVVATLSQDNHSNGCPARPPNSNLCLAATSTFIGGYWEVWFHYIATSTYGR